MDIHDLDLARAVIAATHHQPQTQMNNSRGTGRTVFVFPDDEPTRTAVAEYAVGSLTLNAKRLLRARTDLYRQIKQSRGAK